METLGAPIKPRAGDGGRRHTGAASGTRGGSRGGAEAGAGQGGIHWLEWGPAAFKRADQEDLPILLNIGASWCHWCHVMDDTTWMDPAVINRVNSDFIPVKVDTDKRPDINDRYNMGGWPTTAFLAPTGDVLTGATYIPPERMVQVLDQVSEYWRENKEELEDRLDELNDRRMERLAAGPGGWRAGEAGPAAEVSDKTIDDVVETITSVYDDQFGGFGLEPKFPQAQALRLLLAQHFWTGGREGDGDGRDGGGGGRGGGDRLLEVVEKTLSYMGNSGTYDDEEGGFFRYSTTRDWSVPHFEKMLEDNLSLLRCYVEAFKVTGNRDFEHTAAGITAFLDASLSNHDTGAFWGSQDADEEYYRLDMAERRKRQPPRVDRTAYTDWNAKAACEYLWVSAALGTDSMRERAIRLVDWLLTECYEPGKTVYHYTDEEGRRQLPGLLSDIAYLFAAVVDAHEATAIDVDEALDKKGQGQGEAETEDHEPGTVQRVGGRGSSGETAARRPDLDAVAHAYPYLRWAEDLFAILERDFRAEGREGGYQDLSIDAETLGALDVASFPVEANSVAACALLKLGQLTGQDKYRRRAEQILGSFGMTYQDFGLAAAPYALAVMNYLHPSEAKVAGSWEDEKTRELFERTRGQYAPGLAVVHRSLFAGPDGYDDTSYATRQGAAIYVCGKDACLPPVDNADLVPGLVKDLERGGARAWGAMAPRVGG